MSSIEKTIVNELGNRINFRIVSEPEDVTIFASGPHSEIDHNWTPMEALTIRDMLIQLFPVNQ